MHTGISSTGDIIIVTTNTKPQEDYWNRRLKELRGVICSPKAFVIAVHEDWPSCAGKGLGTLFAYHQAQEKAKFMYHTDLFEMQKKGASVAIYHFAGEGKKLFPILASELINKADVKLPGTLDNRRLTLLEAAISNTTRPALQPKGRLTVFWGDQIIIPTKQFRIPGDHHIEVLSHSRKTLGPFSLSAQMTFAFLREFENDLKEKRGCFESDEHFWKPLTLEYTAYANFMAEMGMNREELSTHYRRMTAFKTKFFQLHSDKNFFRELDIGAPSYLWDYSSTKSYYQNMLKLASLDQEGQMMKIFYNISSSEHLGRNNRLISDDKSCLIDCNINSGKITNSVLIGVTAASLEAKNCVIINSKLASVIARDSLFYNVKEKNSIRFSPGTIRVDVDLPKTKEQLILYSHRDRDGKADWDTKLPQNPFSFKEVHSKIFTQIS